MLVLKRKEGQWVEVTHRSGDILRFRVYHISGGMQGRVCLAFQDNAHHFTIQRPERPCFRDDFDEPGRAQPS